ncbi:MAG: DUF1937 family protein [Aquificota bacterium]|nr:MAG: DUF1937 family protein [Aquificota bacterium]
MLIAYVAGKYTAKTKEEKIENVNQAEEIGKKLLKIGVSPIIPHKISMLWDYDEQFKNWDSDMWLERFCFPLLSASQMLVVCPNYHGSYGVKREIEYAQSIGMPVVYYKNDDQLYEEVGKIIEDFFEGNFFNLQ